MPQSVAIQLSERLADELQEAVKSGRFSSADEVVNLALREFLESRRLELMEQQQLDDVAWALNESAKRKSCK